jgi:perosamine synthetase
MVLDRALMADLHERVPPSWPRFDPDVEAALHAAITSGEWGQYRGANVPQLEADLAAFHDVAHVFTCASGTVAVEIALRALRVAPGDEVIMAAYEYESNFLTIHALGAKPVLLDIAPGNWNLDPKQLPQAVSTQTKAILCSHLHGGLVPMRDVMSFAQERHIGVVEDAAQAPGATVQGRVAGTWGDIGTLSFGGSKLLTAGRGGAILIRDAQVAHRASVALHRGVQPFAPMSELQAAALIPQLKKLPEQNRLRAERVAWLRKQIAKLVPGLHPFENEHDAGEPAHYKLGFRYDFAAFGLLRGEFVKAMRAEGIAFDAGFNALHMESRAAHDGCVMLHHPVLLGSAREMQQVIEALRRVSQLNRA